MLKLTIKEKAKRYDKLVARYRRSLRLEALYAYDDFVRSRGKKPTDRELFDHMITSISYIVVALIESAICISAEERDTFLRPIVKKIIREKTVEVGKEILCRPIFHMHE